MYISRIWLTRQKYCFPVILDSSDVIYTHPKIEDVAVIGIYNEEWGELPRAIYVARKGIQCSADEIMEYCRTKLASYKRPRSEVFVDELPRNSLGKMVKFCFG
jgi:acyl-CoA synthetase (AMP-forming)/AMP-acid ligase II